MDWVGRVGGVCALGLRFATPQAVFWRPFRALVVVMIGSCGLGWASWVCVCAPGVPRATRGKSYGLWLERRFCSETPSGVNMDLGFITPGVAGGYSREALRALGWMIG